MHVRESYALHNCRTTWAIARWWRCIWPPQSGLLSCANARGRIAKRAQLVRHLEKMDLVAGWTDRESERWCAVAGARPCTRARTVRVTETRGGPGRVLTGGDGPSECPIGGRREAW